MATRPAFRTPQLFLLALILMLFFSAAQAGAWWGDDSGDAVTDTIDRTIDVTPDVRIDIDNTNGAIRIETWDRDQVEVSAEKRARGRDAEQLLADTEIVIDGGGSALSIRAELPRTGWRGGSVSVRYTLTVPRGAAVDATSTNGAVVISDLDGAAKLRSTNGSIKVDGLGGTLDAGTTNGSITAYGVRSTASASTTNGSIKVEITGGSLDGDAELRTTNGSVTLMLAADTRATIEARTRNGRVRTTNLTMPSDAVVEKRSMAFDHNGGGPRISLRTTNGSIRVGEGPMER
ncbi:MAG: DUF4097 family beta strand repeat-containing protein [Acidobacteriota bacterium]